MIKPLLVSIMLDYAQTMLGTPYIYGGNGAGGIDCSGFVNELLKSVGIVDRWDRNAQGIHDTLIKQGAKDVVYNPQKGDVVFYGKDDNSITHVSMIYYADNKDILIIEAGGGGSKTKTEAVAREQGAQVRIRPLTSRKDIIKILSFI